MTDVPPQSASDPSVEPTRVPGGALHELQQGEVRAVRFTPTPDGMRREVLVLRDADGVVHAYRNRCQHLPILLDAGSRQYLTPDGTHILCNTHGARYRREDGFCVSGPCVDKSLERVAFVVEGDSIVLLDDGD